MSFHIPSIRESITSVHDLSAAAKGLFENRQAKTVENPLQSVKPPWYVPHLVREQAM